MEGDSVPGNFIQYVRIIPKNTYKSTHISNGFVIFCCCFKREKFHEISKSDTKCFYLRNLEIAFFIENQ